MLYKTARVIATLDCNRGCPYCVNKQPGILEQAKPLTNLLELGGYRAVVITGGEPALRPEKLLPLLYAIRKVGRHLKLFLYLADFSCVRLLPRILAAVDGITYTVHANATEADILRLVAIQAALEPYSHKANRLVLFDGNVLCRDLKSKVWHSLKLIKPNPACQVPSNETLYMLAPALWNSRCR